MNRKDRSVHTAMGPRRLLQFDTHRSTSTPSTHRPSRLAKADPPEAPSTNPRASWAVSGILASHKKALDIASLSVTPSTS
ncbi:MAG: hypothetical protein FRX49_03271 [Trebouxia sp. A1-2]|nr:MAG: hypothetical protein FRX49_03271 [Trebouxia sp. A1-2]